MHARERRVWRSDERDLGGRVLGRENEARTVWGHGAWGARHVGAEECVREHCSTCDRKVNLLELCKRVCKNLIQKYSFCFSLRSPLGFLPPARRECSAVETRRETRVESVETVWVLWTVEYAVCAMQICSIWCVLGSVGVPLTTQAGSQTRTRDRSYRLVLSRFTT